MAYMSQERKKKLAPVIKKICKKHGVKATLSVRNHSTLNLNVSEGPIKFTFTNNRGEVIKNSVNEYWYHESYADNPKALAFLSEVIPAMNNGNHDNSDIMTDYFDVGWYISVNIGKWDKEYIQRRYV